MEILKDIGGFLVEDVIPFLFALVVVWLAIAFLLWLIATPVAPSPY